MEKNSAKKKKIFACIAGIVVIAAIVLLIVLPKNYHTESAPTAPQTEQAGAISAAEPQTEEEETTAALEKETAKKQEPAVKEETQKETEEQKQEKDSCTLTISNGAASANTKEAVNGLHVYSPESADLEDYFSGQEVPKGTFISIFVYNLASPVSLHIEHNGQVIADRTYPIREAFVDDATVEYFEFHLEGDLVVTTSAISAAEVKKQEAPKPKEENVQPAKEKTAKEKTSKDDSPEAAEKSYKVTIENKVKAKDGTLTIGYVNAKEEAVMIKSGKKYDRDLVIGARALNYNGSRKLKLSAYDKDGKKLDSVKIKTGTKKNPGANGFYLTLKGATKYVLEYADKAGKPTKKSDKTKQDQKAESFTVQVQNGAASANTQEAVNGLHVYSLDDPDMEDINGKTTLKKGTKVRIFAYPLASDIHLKIVHNGTVVADKDIKKMQAWVDDDKVEYFNLTLQGDLQVITSVVAETQPSQPPQEPEQPTQPETQPEVTQPETEPEQPTQPETETPVVSEPLAEELPAGEQDVITEPAAQETEDIENAEEAEKEKP